KYSSILGEIEENVESIRIFCENGLVDALNFEDSNGCQFTGCNGNGNTDPRFKRHRSVGHCPNYLDFINNGHKELMERLAQKEYNFLIISNSLEKEREIFQNLQARFDEIEKKLLVSDKENQSLKIQLCQLESEIKTAQVYDDKIKKFDENIENFQMECNEALNNGYDYIQIEKANDLEIENNQLKCQIENISKEFTDLENKCAKKSHQSVLSNDDTIEICSKKTEVSKEDIKIIG
ncbi:unnamed protein product, partial [Brachionus calyciflorus]